MTTKRETKTINQHKKLLPEPSIPQLTPTHYDADGHPLYAIDDVLKVFGLSATEAMALLEKTQPSKKVTAQDTIH